MFELELGSITAIRAEDARIGPTTPIVERHLAALVSMLGLELGLPGAIAGIVWIRATRTRITFEVEQ